MFTLSPVFYLTVDFKKVGSDLFHAGSTLVESKCIKRKTYTTGKPPKHNNNLKTFSNGIYDIPRACLLNRSLVPAMDLKSNRSGL